MTNIVISPKVGLNEKHIENIRSADNNADLKIAKDVDEFKNLLKDAEIIVTYPTYFPKNFSKEMAPKLKWIQSMSAGVNKYMIPGVINSDIILTTSSGVHPIPIAEHVLGMMLSFERNLHLSRDCQNNNVWKEFGDNEVSELYEKTVTIIGLGNIGLRIAELVKAFGAKVIGIKRSVGEKPSYVDELHAEDKIDSVLPVSDYVIVCVPFTQETKNMFDAERLKKMKKGSIIINIGRGGTIDENALIEQLKIGHLKGAGLDVFEEEPLSPTSEFYRMRNVILTAHDSGHTPKYTDRAIEIFCKNLRLRAENKEMINVVDMNRGY